MYLVNKYRLFEACRKFSRVKKILFVPYFQMIVNKLVVLWITLTKTCLNIPIYRQYVEKNIEIR